MVYIFWYFLIFSTDHLKQKLFFNLLQKIIFFFEIFPENARLYHARVFLNSKKEEKIAKQRQAIRKTTHYAGITWHITHQKWFCRIRHKNCTVKSGEFGG